MAHACSITKDPEMARRMDEWIAIIAKAQGEDGYVSVNMTESNVGRTWVLAFGSTR